MDLAGKYAFSSEYMLCQPGSAAEFSSSVHATPRTAHSMSASERRELWKYWLAREIHFCAEGVLEEKAGN